MCTVGINTYGKRKFDPQANEHQTPVRVWASDERQMITICKLVIVISDTIQTLHFCGGDICAPT